MEIVPSLRPEREGKVSQSLTRGTIHRELRLAGAARNSNHSGNYNFAWRERRGESVLYPLCSPSVLLVCPTG